MNTKNILALVGVLVLAAIIAYLALRTDTFDRLFAEPETAQERQERIVTEQRKNVIDEQNLFSVLIPESWEVQFDGSTGTRVSGITATTEDFNEVSSDEGMRVSSGARFQVIVQSADSTLPAFDNPLIEEVPVLMGDAQQTASLYAGPGNASYIIVADRTQGEYQYRLLMEYSPGSYPYGEQLFDSVAKSLRIF